MPGVKDRLLETWRQGHDPAATVTAARRRPRDVMPLSYAQERLWFLDQLVPAGVYNVPAALRVRGSLDVRVLAQSAGEIVRRHDVLRTRIVSEAGAPVQEIAPPVAVVAVPVIDLERIDAARREDEARRLLIVEARRPFALARGALWRVTVIRLDATEHLIALTAHHIVSDGWSVGVWTRELLALTAALQTGVASPLPDLSLQYADYAAWQRDWLHREVLERELQFWRAQLADAPTLALPTDRPRLPALSYRGATCPVVIGREVYEALKAVGQQQRATLFMTLAAAFVVVLHRYTGQDDICVGTPTAGRARTELESLIGFFVNTLVLRVGVDGESTFAEVLRRVREAAIGAYAHQHVPFEKLVAELQPARDPGRNPLFQAMVSLQNARSVALAGTIWPGSLHPAELFDVGRGSAKFDLELYLEEWPTGIYGYVEYPTDLFDAPTIERLITHYRTLLAAVAADPEQPVWALPLLSQGERRQVLDVWNETTTMWPAGLCVHQLFEAQAVRTPDAVAVVWGSEQVSYQALAARAARLSATLREHGVGPEVRVGVWLDRSIDLVVALIAILDAGGAYVPLDPAYPTRRIEWMLEDAAVSVVVTRPGLRDRLPSTAAVVLDVGCASTTTGTQPAAPASASSPDQLAYVMYTSGSTGTPKGVMVPHRAITRLVLETNYVSLGPGSRIGQGSNASFDAATFEIWGALLTGGTLVGIERETLLAPRALAAALKADEIDVLWLTASVFGEVAREVPEAFRDLEYVLFGGEAVEPRWVELVQEAGPPRHLVNGYGPTEGTTFSLCHEVDRPTAAGGPVPIGRPIANTRAYILDTHGQPVPMGVAGEIHIGGAGLARGYWRRAAQTAERFVPDPFGPPGERLYRTGDLGRYRPNGAIEFLGRVDTQVKLRGHRIELGEIETALRSHPAVDDAAVVLAGASTGDRRLIAYVVPGTDARHSERANGAGSHDEHVSRWQDLFDTLYEPSPEGIEDASPRAEAMFDFTGWESTYTREPIPDAEMREWLRHTIARIQALRPARVLEIGCGTGLLLLRLAPHCERYCGTDFSLRALDAIRGQMAGLDGAADHVELLQCHADDFDRFDDAAFDTVILNSVVQYFPDADYLLRVLKGARRVVRDGGTIFIGDVRNLALLEAYALSVETHRAAPGLSHVELSRRVRQRVAREEELLVDPRFFAALSRDIPGFHDVEILLKRGGARNELTRFRYDAIVHVARGDDAREPGPVSDEHEIWREWTESTTVDSIRRLLEDTGAPLAGIQHIPNPRVGEDGIDPEEWWTLEAGSSYSVHVTWARGDATGRYDVLVSREGVSPAAIRRACRAPVTDASGIEYTNVPARAPFSRLQSAALRAHLRQRLPEFMVPGLFVELDAMPLTPNGKVDRRALPAWDIARPDVASAYVAPRTGAETIIAAIWAEVLGLERVGVDDDFFELGGHSLLATQVVSRVRRALGVELPLRDLFEEPTVAALARRVALPATADTMVGIPKANRARPLPLSYAQERLWFLDQLLPNDALYNVPAALRVGGAVDVRLLAQCVGEVVRRHEALRTTFRSDAGVPHQVIAPPARVTTLPVVDLTGLNETARELEVRRLTSEDARRPFLLARGPLWRARTIRLAPDEHVVSLVVHHIVCDGWSLGLCLRELTAISRALELGLPAAAPDLPVQYADYAAWQRETLHGEVVARELRYWRERLAGAPVLMVPADRPRPALPSFRGATCAVSIDAGLARRLHELGRDRGATLFMTLLAAFLVLLHRHTGQEDISVGTPIAGRTRQELEGIIGFFVNTLVLRTDLRGELTFIDVLERVRETALAAYAHQAVPFEKLVAEVRPARDLSRNPLFQVMFSLQTARSVALGDTTTFPGAAAAPVEVLDIARQSAKFDLDLYLEEWPTGIHGYVEYATDLFDESTIERLIGHFQTLLVGVVADPQQAVWALPMMTGDEQRRLLDVSAASGGDRFRNARSGVHTLFHAQAARTPDATAVVCGQVRVSYAALAARARVVARVLRRLGVGPEVRVGLCVSRSVDLIVGMLGILEAGGAYLPLDPEYPSDRLALMTDDAQVPLILSQRALADRLPPRAGRVLCLDEEEFWRDDAAGDDAPAPEIDGDNAAYVIYTSGSTGRPKGVLVTHDNVVRLLRETEAWFHFDERDVWTLFHSYAFDFSVWEIWGALAYGGRIVIVPHDVSRWPEAFLRLLAAERVTVLNQTPSAFRSLVRAEASADAGELALRLVIFGGEALDLASLKPWVDRHGDERPQLINMYGITETTVHVTAGRIRAADIERPRGSIIGARIPDLRLYILDEHRQLVPVGVAGEMYVGGAGVARGYLRRPDLTAERFVPDPFCESAGDRLYRTGDLARYLGDGTIEFLGRADAQVKLRGYRIEPGEIEAALLAQPGVADAAVALREDANGDRRLIAYVVARDGAAVDATELRTALKARLPGYMVPSAFAQIAALPLGPSGKVNRRALPSPDPLAADAARAAAPPRPGIEQKLAEHWRTLLHVTSVDRNENFFDAGGHSLLLPQILRQVQDAFDVELTLVDLFEYPTIASLAAHIRRRQTLAPVAVAGRELHKVREGHARLQRQRDARGREKRSHDGTKQSSHEAHQGREARTENPS